MATQVKRRWLTRNYKWDKGDGEAGERDAYLFNRREGYEVMPMIQRVVNRLELDPHHVTYLEDMIAEKLPGNIRGKDRVFNWLVKTLNS